MMTTDDRTNNEENPFGTTLPTSEDPVEVEEVSPPSVVETQARANGLGALWQSTVKLTTALGERTKEIDQNLGFSKTVVKVSKDIDDKLKVQKNATAIGTTIGNTAKGMDSKFHVSETTMKVGSVIGATAKDLDAKLDVVGKLKGFEEKTKVVEKSSNLLASGADWATDKIKPKAGKDSEDDENW